MIVGLPAPVTRYFLHAIAPGTPLATSVKLKLQGQFRMGQDKSWLPMRGQEILNPKGFVWKAVIGEGLFQFKGSDSYLNNSGRMQFSLWGLVPLVNAHSDDITRSSIGRMGELVWLPSTLLPQQGVIWKAIDNSTIQASLQIDGEPITLTLVIDADGKVLELWLPRWGNCTKRSSKAADTSTRTWSYIPFGGKCQAESTFNGFTIPSQISAGWWFGTAHYAEFFQATIEQAEFF